jgi:hypothetical protein
VIAPSRAVSPRWQLPVMAASGLDVPWQSDPVRFGGQRRAQRQECSPHSCGLVEAQAESPKAAGSRSGRSTARARRRRRPMTGPF